MSCKRGESASGSSSVSQVVHRGNQQQGKSSKNLDDIEEAKVEIIDDNKP